MSNVIDRLQRHAYVTIHVIPIDNLRIQEAKVSNHVQPNHDLFHHEAASNTASSITIIVTVTAVFNPDVAAVFPSAVKQAHSYPRDFYILSPCLTVSFRKLSRLAPY